MLVAVEAGRLVAGHADGMLVVVEAGRLVAVGVGRLVTERGRRAISRWTRSRS